MKKTLSVILLLLACAMASALTNEVKAQASNCSTEQAAVTPLLPQDMPVEINSTAVTKGEGRAVLTFSVRSKEQLSSVELTAIVYDARGFAKAGEGWRKSLNRASSGSRHNFTVAMKTEVLPGDRIVLMAYNAYGREGAWKADPGKLAASANALVAGKSYTLPKAVFTKDK